MDDLFEEIELEEWEEFRDVEFPDEVEEIEEVEEIIKEASKLPPKHRILREVYRHYLDFQDFWRLGGYGSSPGKHIIEYKGIAISFLDLDLKKNLKKLSGRKKEAFILNVLCDMKQKDVAKIMGITTVSVGQYVEAAVIQLAKDYFVEDE